MEEIITKLNNLSITHLFQIYFIMFNKKTNLEKHQIINELLYPLEEENFKYLIDNDPKKFKNAKKYDNITCKKYLNNNRKVMDSSAISVAKDNNIPIIVLSISEKECFFKN